MSLKGFIEEAWELYVEALKSNKLNKEKLTEEGRDFLRHVFFAGAISVVDRLGDTFQYGNVMGAMDDELEAYSAAIRAMTDQERKERAG